MPALGKPTSATSATVFSSRTTSPSQPEGAEQREAGCLALGVGERGVAEAALTAGRDDESHAGLVEVGELAAVGRRDHGAQRNRQLERLTLIPAAVVAHAGSAVAARAVRAAVVAEQGRDLRVGDERDVAAVAAVAAVGSGERLELLALDRDAAVAAVTGAQVERHLVDEGRHGSHSFRYENGKGEPKLALAEESSWCRTRPTGTMLTTLRPPLWPNSTAPASRANRVSSPPRPTFCAGVEVGAALADDDLAGLDDLAAEALDAEVLRVRVATVAGRGRALFVCHVLSLLRSYLMPVILTRVSSERWPWRFLYPVLFLNFWMTILGPRRSVMTSAVTLILARSLASWVILSPST